MRRQRVDAVLVVRPISLRRAHSNNRHTYTRVFIIDIIHYYFYYCILTFDFIIIIFAVRNYIFAVSIRRRSAPAVTQKSPRDRRIYVDIYCDNKTVLINKRTKLNERERERLINSKRRRRLRNKHLVARAHTHTILVVTQNPYSRTRTTTGPARTKNGQSR